MELLQPANLMAWAIQAAIVVVVASPLPRLLGMWSPRVRMAYWRAVLVGCLLLPLLQPWAVREIPAAASPGAPSLSVDVVGSAATPGIPGSSFTENVVARASRLRWPPIGVSEVLAAGILLRLAWLGLGVITLGRLRRSARPLWPRPPSVDRAATLAETDAEFLVSATSSRPVTCGWAWPVVLVPRTFETFPEHEQTAIATHELLHVGRADWARNAVDEVVRAVLWFHPGIWYLINQIQLSREQVVDREAVRRLGTRQPYLEALLRLAKPAPRLVLTPASLFLKRAHLRQRVTLLVKEVSMSRARLVASLAVMAVVLFIGGRLAAAAFPLQQAETAKPASQTEQQKPVAGAPRPGMPTTGSGAGSGVPGGVVGGVRGGVPGGVGGGVPGGVGGGVAGGVGDGVPGGVGGATGADGRITITQEQLAATPVSSVSGVVRRADPDAPGTSGRAIVGIVIAADGSVRSATTAAGVSREAAAAARNWQFEPGPDGRASLLGFNLTPGNTSGATDVPTVRIGGNVPPPVKVRDVKPAYPEEARQAGLQGVQILEVSVAPSGEVLDARALRGQLGLVQAAIDAVLQWEFTPWDGTERRIMTVTVNFALDPNAGGRPSTWAPGALRVGGNIKPPAKFRDVKPVYPQEAQDARVQGVVIFEILVGPDGLVKDARVLRSIPLLDQAAEEAVRQWQFTPTLVNGNPVPLIMTVTVNFTLQ
jgi:TonB family protein